jgi:pimeloyl-ACP methyl ester carboxylesterase
MGPAAVREPDLEPGRVGGPLLVNGVELSWRESGAGAALLCLHETAATAAIWDPLAEAIGGDVRTIALDRRGWGASGAPEQYSATTVEEQAADAAALLEGIDVGEAIICGAGLGAVTALELLMRRRDLARAAILIEPPLLAFLPQATEGLAADRETIAEAVRQGGPQAAMDLYLTGGLPHLGPGAGRIPAPVGAVASERPLSLFAELGAVPTWSLRTPEMAALRVPSRIVVGASAPPLLDAVSEELATRLGGSELVRLGATGLPHVSAAPELAAVVRELLSGE